MKNIPTEQLDMEQSPPTTPVHEQFYSIRTELIQPPKKKKKTWILFPILGGVLTTAIIAAALILFPWDTRPGSGPETPTPENPAVIGASSNELTPNPAAEEDLTAAEEKNTETESAGSTEETPFIIILPNTERPEPEQETVPKKETAPETETTPEPEPEPTSYIIQVQPTSPVVVIPDSRTSAPAITSTPIPMQQLDDQVKILNPWQNGEEPEKEPEEESSTNPPPDEYGNPDDQRLPQTPAEIRGSNAPRFGWINDNGRKIFFMEIKTIEEVTEIDVNGPDMAAAVIRQYANKSWDPDYPVLWRIPISAESMTSGRYTVVYFMGGEFVTEDVWAN